MKLRKVIVKSIRSYKDQEINFPDGAVLLAGDIGSGKTSLLLAIEYALFGLQPGQKGSALLRNNANEGEVILCIEVDGKEITIERKLKRSPKGVTNDYAAIIIDGVREESSLTEIKTIILEKIGYPVEYIKKNNILYRYTVFTPQEHMKQIILEDPETRLNIIRHIFGIDKYKRIKENSDILLSHIKEDIKLILREIKRLDEDRQMLNERKETLISISLKIKDKEKDLQKKIEERNKIEDYRKELDEKIQQKRNFEKEIEKTNILLRAKLDSLSLLKKEFLELQELVSEEIKFNPDDYKNLLDNIKKKKDYLEKLNLDYLEVNSQLTALERNKENSLQQKERIFKLEICPICLQNVSENHKHTIMHSTQSFLNNIQSQIDILNNEKIHIKNVLTMEEDQINKLEENKLSMEIAKSKKSYLERSEDKLANINKTKGILEKDISLLEKHISQLKATILEFSKYDNLYRKNELLLGEAINAEKLEEISIAELKKEYELTEKYINEFQKEIEEKEREKARLSSLLELNDWIVNKFLNLVEFTERSVLISLRLEFSKLFAKWFHMLVPQESLQVQLDESFSPIIIQGDIEMEYGFLSGGERTAVALAYRLALNQTLNMLLSKIKTNDLVILDEPTEGFSDSQIDKMRDVFEELDVSQLLIVSHEQKIEGFVDHIIRVKKQGDLSIIEGES